MNKNDLIAQVAAAAELTKIDTTKAVNAVFEAISTSLKNKEAVRLIGFGTFEVRERAATTGRNPRTGKTLEIAACNVPKFRPGKALKKDVA